MMMRSRALLTRRTPRTPVKVARPTSSMVCFSDPPSRRLTGNERLSPRALLKLVSAVLGASLITGALTFLVWLKIEQVQAGYSIFALQMRLLELRQEQSALQVERTALRRPERLSRLAQQKLGLFPVRPDQVIDVDGGKK